MAVEILSFCVDGALFLDRNDVKAVVLTELCYTVELAPDCVEQLPYELLLKLFFSNVRSAHLYVGVWFFDTTNVKQ